MSCLIDRLSEIIHPNFPRTRPLAGSHLISWLAHLLLPSVTSEVPSLILFLFETKPNKDLIVVYARHACFHTFGDSLV